MSDLNANDAERVTNNKFLRVEIKPLSESQTKSNAIRGALFQTALISFVMLAVAFFIAENHSDIALFLMMSFVFLGLYVFVALWKQHCCVILSDYARLAKYDALFIRETTSVDNHTYRFAKKAENEGLVVMDDSASILRCTNKVFQGMRGGSPFRR